MILIKQFEKQGNYLFKNRSFFPILILIPALSWFIYLQFTKLQPNHWYIDLIFLCIGFIGLGIRCFTIGYTPQGTSGRNTREGQIAESLNTEGIYSIVRHPLYLGNFFMWLAPALMIMDLWFIIFFCAFYWIYYERIMIAEESFLINKFGQSYINWAENTPAFIPKFSIYKHSSLKFSLKNVLRREYNGFFNLVMIFFIFRIIAYYIHRNEFYIDTIWLCIFIIAACIFIVLKILNKFTNVLKVEGR